MSLQYLASLFDAPISSNEHKILRDEAWLGGELVEGRYLLGRLQDRNFFHDSNNEYYSSLESHFAATFNSTVANVLASGGHLGVLVLQHQCKKFPDISIRGMSRKSEALYLITSDPALSDLELAERLGTTAKQVARLSDVSHFRCLMKRESNVP